MGALENIRHERFCQLYARGWNGTRSYNLASPTNRSLRAASVRAHELVASRNIRARIDEIQGEWIASLAPPASLCAVIEALVARAVKAKKFKTATQLVAGTLEMAGYTAPRRGRFPRVRNGQGKQYGELNTLKDAIDRAQAEGWGAIQLEGMKVVDDALRLKQRALGEKAFMLEATKRAAKHGVPRKRPSRVERRLKAEFATGVPIDKDALKVLVDLFQREDSGARR
jgi:hypothetical protein